MLVYFLLPERQNKGTGLHTHTLVLPRKKNKTLQNLWTCLYITVLSALCTSSNLLQTKPVSVPGSPDKLCGMTLWITPLIHYTLPTQIPRVNVDRAVFNDSSVSKNIASLSVFQPKEQSQLQNSRALYYAVTDNMKLFQRHDASVGALHFRHRLQCNLTLKTLVTLPLLKFIMGKKVKTHQNTSTKVKEHFYFQETKHALLHKTLKYVLWRISQQDVESTSPKYKRCMKKKPYKHIGRSTETFHLFISLVPSPDNNSLEFQKSVLNSTILFIFAI